GSPRRDQTDCHQHARRRGALTDDPQWAGVRRSRRSVVLWSKLRGPVPARGQLCRQDSARGKSSRPSGRATDKVRSRHQPDHGESAWPRSAAVAARHCRRGDRMRTRRQFITLLGSAAAWPLAARAQRAERMRRIGVLMNLAADDPEGQARLAAFLQGLQQAGWSVGGNIRIDYRWGAGDAELFRKYAAELVALAADVFLASGNPSVTALQQATRSLPIVFAPIADPVAS